MSFLLSSIFLPIFFFLIFPTSYFHSLGSDFSYIRLFHCFVFLCSFTSLSFSLLSYSWLLNLILILLLSSLPLFILSSLTIITFLYLLLSPLYSSLVFPPHPFIPNSSFFRSSPSSLFHTSFFPSHLPLIFPSHLLSLFTLLTVSFPSKKILCGNLHHHYFFPLRFPAPLSFLFTSTPS